MPMLTIALAPVLGLLSLSQGQERMNPVIDLLARQRPVFGLYAPSNRRGRGAQADTTPPRSAAQLAAEALAHAPSDYVFDGSMEGDFDRGYGTFSEFVKGMGTGGSAEQRRAHPLVVKMRRITGNPAAGEQIARQLNLGVAGVVFVGVESAEEVRQGLAAMRFKGQGGTRPDDVGAAPAYWGVSDKDYRAKADLWPLNPKGELINFTIVESKEGLAHVREIAAVPGIGVLFPGAGTLRGVFSTTDANGQRVLDEKAWEAAIQQVLAACKEFKVACGYPATANDIEMRMQQGFSVFVINWGDAGFRAVEVGRKAAGR